MFKYLITVIAFITTAQCFAADTNTEIGAVDEPHGSHVAFVLRQWEDAGVLTKKAYIVASDKHAISRVMYPTSGEHLKDFREMVGAIITKIAAPTPKGTEMTSTDFGEVHVHDGPLNEGGSVFFSIIHYKVERFASLHISDENNNEIDIPFRPKELKKLLNLIDKTIAELGQPYKTAIRDNSGEMKTEQQNRIGEPQLMTLGTGPTSTYNFAGTSWRDPSAYNDIYVFKESGVLSYKNPRGYSYGVWKVEHGVLRFTINRYSNYDAKIDGDWLVVNGHNTTDSWSTRWYRTDNEKIDKDIKKDFDQSIEDFSNAIEAQRINVLNESPETEALLQKGQGEQYGGQHWLNLCDAINLRLKARSIALSGGTKSESELCYNWYGTRHKWKETILKDGCKGRCRP